MSEANGFCCPQCGNEGRFTIDAIVMYGPTRVYADGSWDYLEDDHDVDAHPEAMIQCSKCGYSAHWLEFPLAQRKLEDSLVKEVV